jgi:integrase
MLGETKKPRARRGLTDRMIKQAGIGVLIDGHGLRLKVTANPRTGDLRKSWIVRVTVKDGPVREIGLGSAFDVPLKQARERAGEVRRLARGGVDPIAARKAAVAQRAAEAARAMTFRQCAEACIEAKRSGWRNAKHAAQWASTLERYAYPVFGNVPVAEVDLAMVLRAIEPIWNTKTETASRLSQRIKIVLDWAATRGLRSGDNPARWHGHLDTLLPARTKVRRVRHHPAMPYDTVPAFMQSLATTDGVGAIALQLLILTAARTSEVLNARWSEFDLDRGVWLVPSERMKAGREHRVALSKPAVALLRRLKQGVTAEWLFPAARGDKPLSNMALLKLLERAGHSDLTVHGFRSSFRDWAAECSAQPREVVEAALAHTVGDKVEAAYRRTDFFDRRRQLMEEWARHCMSPKRGDVVSLRGRKEQ